MLPIRIYGATHAFKAPEGWDEQKNGRCGEIAVRRDGVMLQTAWEPTPFELQVLNAGGSVVLTVFGDALPPVALTVELPPQDLGGE